MTKVLSDWYRIDREDLKHYDIKKIKKDLIERPREFNSGYGEKGNTVLFRETQDYLYVPRYYGIDVFGNPDEFDLSEGWELDVDFNGSLEEEEKSQITLTSRFIDRIHNTKGGLLSAPCGTGKTVMALYILSKLKTHTLVLVNKEFIMQQWVDRINEFLKGEFSVGIIQQDKCEYKEDIVIGMLQSFNSREYSDKLFKSFGLVIADECFTANTRVMLSDGSQMPIGKLVDSGYSGEVMSYDPDTGEFVKKRVLRHFKKKPSALCRVKFGGRFPSVTCTPNHKFMTESGLVRVDELSAGDNVITLPPSCLRFPESRVLHSKHHVLASVSEVVSASIDKKSPYVYNFEVEDTHLYIVGKGHVVSNCHHMSAPTFFNTITKFNPSFMAGLSATPTRGDGLEGVFLKHIGPILAETRSMNVGGSVYQIGVNVPGLKDKMFKYKNNFYIARWINKIAKLDERTKLVAKHAVKLASTGRKVMVLSHRLNHVDAIIKEVEELEYLAGKCTGGMSAEEVFNTFKEYDIVVGTYQFISEAVDIPELNGMVLATPHSNIEQAIGRLTRTNVKKKRPIVTEIVDVWSSRSKGYAFRHKKIYDRLGFEVK